MEPTGPIGTGTRTMGKRAMLLPVAAAAVVTCLTGCPPRESGGGGGGTLMAASPSELTGDQLAFAEAFARAPWAVANVGAGDWAHALRDITYVQDRIVAMKRSGRLIGPARVAIAGLQPKTDALALRVQAQDPAALAMAASLVDDFGRVAVQLADSGWLAAGWDGARQGTRSPQQAPAPPPGSRVGNMGG